MNIFSYLFSGSGLFGSFDLFSWFSPTTSGPQDGVSGILLETGSYLLLESGNYLLCE